MTHDPFSFLSADEQAQLRETLREFSDNSLRMDILLNGDEQATYQSKFGQTVPSVRRFFAELEKRVSQERADKMSTPEPDRVAALWACLIVPLAIAFLVWSLWPSADDSARWNAIVANAHARGE